MIIFEDDTICKKDSERKLKGFLGRLQNIDFKNIYIDLAGGLNPYDVIPKRKIDNNIMQMARYITEGIIDALE